MAAVGGLDPSVLVAPDYQTQMLQAQKRLALADALRQQSMTDTPGNGGTVSWSQGLARLAEAFAANRAQKKGYQQMQGANQAYARGIQSLFGMPPGVPQMGQGAPSGDSGTPTSAAPQSVPQGFDPAAIAATAQGKAVAPVAPPQAASTPPSAPPSAPTGGASNQPLIPQLPGMTREQSMMAYFTDPGGYWDKVASAHSPTDFIKTLSAAGIDPNSPLGRQILQGQLAKQNYIAPVSGRGGGWTIYSDGHKEFNPQAPAPGAMPVIGQDGQPTGAWTEDPSASSIQAHQAGAVAQAQAAGKAPFETINGFQDGKPVIMPKSAVTGGVLNGIYHPGAGAVQSGPALGQSSAANAAGTNSANQFNDAVTAGQGAKSAMFQIDRIMQAANGLATGPGAHGLSHVKSAINAVTGAAGAGPVFDRDRIAKFDEIQKNVAALGLSLSQASGQQTTDARLKTALEALPNSSYSPKAIQEVGLNLKGLQASALARGNAAAAWQQQHGPGDWAAFSQQWNNAYNPEIFYNMQKGVPAFQSWAQHLPPAQRAHVLQQYRTMKALGAF